METLGISLSRIRILRVDYAAEVKCEEVKEAPEAGVKVFEVDKARMTSEESRKCKSILDEMMKYPLAKSFTQCFERVPRANTFVRASRRGDP